MFESSASGASQVERAGRWASDARAVAGIRAPCRSGTQPPGQALDHVQPALARLGVEPALYARHHGVLGLPEQRCVDEVGREHRAGHGDRPTEQDDGVVRGAVATQNRNAAQRENVEEPDDLGFVGQRHRDHVEVVKWGPRLVADERCVRAAPGLQVVGEEGTLGGDAALSKQGDDPLKPQRGHPRSIGRWVDHDHATRASHEQGAPFVGSPTLDVVQQGFPAHPNSLIWTGSSELEKHVLGDVRHFL